VPLRSTLPVLFTPSARFFLRTVPVSADAPVAGQVELALEGLAPFPLAQLYWGHWLASDGRQALVYAAHRRQFVPEETAGWARAELVVPDVLPLCAGPAPAGAGVYLWETDGQLAGAAWADAAGLPAAVLVRAGGAPGDEAARQQLADELATRAGLKAPVVRVVAGQPQAYRRGDRLGFELAGPDGAVVVARESSRSEQDQLDLRDRAHLPARRRERRQREMVWRGLVAGLAGLGIAALLEGAGFGFGLAQRMVQGRIAAQAPLVQKLETAQGLTNRVDDLTHRRLRFFEMLAAVNGPRPGSVQFTRVGNAGRNGLEIEAATTSADDVSRYEAALAGLGALDHVEVSELQSRDGRTTFNLSILFKPEVTRPGGGGT